MKSAAAKSACKTAGWARFNGENFHFNSSDAALPWPRNSRSADSFGEFRTKTQIKWTTHARRCHICSRLIYALIKAGGG